MRIIDADALKESLNNKKVVGRFNTIQLIDNAPTVDTTCPNCDSGYAHGYSDGYLKGKEERPQGEWIDDDNYYANCSCCDYQMDTHEEHGYFKFCPNCGAEMTKEAENV